MSNTKRALGEEQVIAKKKCKGPVIFYVRIPQCTVLRSFCESIAQIVSDGFFSIVKSDEFSGIRVQTMDTSRACMIMGQLSATVEATQEKYSFCIRMSSLINHLKSCSFSNFIDLWIDRESQEVSMRIFEPDNTSFSSSFNLRTLAKDNDVVPLLDLTYSYLVELDLKTFGQSVKAGKDSKAEILNFKIYKGEVISFFVISYESLESSGSFCYPSSVQTNEAGELVLKAGESQGEIVDDIETLEVVYSDSFSCDYLNMITRSVSQHFVHIRLGKDTPLTIETSLNGASNDSDHLRFILAPREC